MTYKIIVPSKKPMNPHVEELFDGTFKAKRERPENQYERKPKYNTILKSIDEKEAEEDAEYLERELDTHEETEDQIAWHLYQEALKDADN